jgi:hypothetical protein
MTNVKRLMTHYTRIRYWRTAPDGGDTHPLDTLFRYQYGCRPLPQVMFKADYGIEMVALKDVETKKFNLGMGYMF